ncbi:hypothetical protein B0H17DRAFT_1196895 [Mycena rosella]|uniref:Uncharacterized protein n=1 Tax=Mycena rosella TaxID=1033263 RepID=A0AAD7DRV4_MYCRO|nr:hypothetical protein B0H17DRAFT_1196895 [Mycena rosella]
MISAQETWRLFGPLNRPDSNTNLRHRAILRKALELFSIEELTAIFERLTRLRVVMRSASTSNQLGKVQTHYVCNGSLVSRETPIPDAEARQALLAYRDAYNTYFVKQGNLYRVRDAQARLTLQAAEQTWHDWIVPYLAVRCLGFKECVLQLRPHPGFQRSLHAGVVPLSHPLHPPLPSAMLALPYFHLRPSQCASVAPRSISSPLHPALPSVATLDVTLSLPSQAGRVRILFIWVHPPKKRKFLGVIDISDVIDYSDNDEVEAVK